MCFIVGILFAASNHAQDAEIFRCTLPDGSVSFQGMPCADPTKPPAMPDPPAKKDRRPKDNYKDDFFDFENPYDNPEPAESVKHETERARSDSRADCERVTRGKIDAIDAKLAALPPAKTARKLLAELMQLTKELRGCKAL